MSTNLKDLIKKSASEKDRGKAIRILARTFYVELRRAGFDENDIISMASEILDALLDKVEDRKQVEK